jgi:hypothetical protein
MSESHSSNMVKLPSNPRLERPLELIRLRRKTRDIVGSRRLLKSGVRAALLRRWSS